MKWYVVPSLLLCSLNCVLAAVILSQAAFHLYVDENTCAPITLHEEWIRTIKNLISFCVAWLIVSLAGMYASMTKGQIYISSMVLVFIGILFGISIYFMAAFASQLDMEDTQAEVLFNITLKEIRSQSAELWIPLWLENTQKQSKECCGIATYRDYTDFWPNANTKLPLSCCRDSKTLTEPCPADLTRIPYPQTPANFIKVESGCMEQINTAIRNHTGESFYLSSVAVTFLGFALLTFLAVYVPQYLMNASWLKVLISRKGSDIVESDNNAELLTDSGLIGIASNDEVGGSLGSAKGVQVIASLQSLATPEKAVLPEKWQPRQFVFASKDATQPGATFPLLPQSSLAKLNKVNTVFAGLQQQQLKQQFPDAVPGGDIPIGTRNLGRREVFVVQDATAQTTRPGSSTILRNINPRAQVGDSTSTSDFAGDMIHVEQIVAPVTQQPPQVQPQQAGRSSSPERSKKKKLRKFPVTFGHHNHDFGNP